MKKYILLFIALLTFFPTTLIYAAADAGTGGSAPTGVCNTDTGLTKYNFKCVTGFVTDMINQLVIILIGVGLLLFIWGLVKYVAAAGDEKKIEEAKRFIVFGLIAFFVMMSVWGLTNILVRTFFPKGGNLIIPQFK